MGRGVAKPPLPQRGGVRARVLEAQAGREGFLEEVTLGRKEGEDCSRENRREDWCRRENSRARPRCLLECEGLSWSFI